jgi:hypothetical protein
MTWISDDGRTLRCVTVPGLEVRFAGGAFFVVKPRADRKPLVRGPYSSQSVAMDAAER